MNTFCTEPVDFQKSFSTAEEFENDHPSTIVVMFDGVVDGLPTSERSEILRKGNYRIIDDRLVRIVD